MNRKTLVITLTLLLAVALSTSVYAIPQYIDYQGKLLDNQTGNPMTGQVIIDFRIWNDLIVGTTQWSTQEIITLGDNDNGLFSVVLGPIPTSVFDGSDRWLGIEVNSDGEMTPRKQIVSVAHAYQAENAATAGTATNATNANYATNAGNASSLGGQPANYFLNTNGGQTINGTLDVSFSTPSHAVMIDNPDASDGTGLHINVNGWRAIFANNYGEGNAASFYSQGTSWPMDEHATIYAIHANGGTVAYFRGGNNTYPTAYFFNVYGGNALALETKGSVLIDGSLQVTGACCADYVFESDYNLESIEDHSKAMWQEKHLPAVPKAKVDEQGRKILEIGSNSKGILEELEKAHIYIEQLNNKMKELEKTVGKLELVKAEVDETTKK